jgi:hypothetical protein
MSNAAVATLFLVLTPVLYWLVILQTRMVRHPRLLAAMIVWTAAWFGSVALRTGPEWAIRVLLVIAVAVAILWPERVGLLSIHGHEADADSLFRRVSSWLRERSTDAAAGMALAASLSSRTLAMSEGEWAVAATLFRRSLLRRAGATASTLTPATAYERAARSFWRAGYERHLLGRRFSPDVWDEGMALRCYHEEFQSLIPREALVERPLIPLGGWDDEAERVVDALRGIPLSTPIARSKRDAQAAAMTDVLAIARGDRSPEALARQRASAEFMTEQWAALAREETGSAQETRGPG